jgi:hypothetical protein
MPGACCGPSPSLSAAIALRNWAPSVRFRYVLRRIRVVVFSESKNVLQGKVGFPPDLESTRMWASLKKAKQPTSASATSEAFGCRCWAFLMLAPACTALRLGSLLASLSRLTHILLRSSFRRIKLQSPPALPWERSLAAGTSAPFSQPDNGGIALPVVKVHKSPLVQEDRCWPGELPHD